MSTTLTDLALFPRFVTWRNEERNGDITKIPYTPGTNKKAKADDPTTWRDRAEATAWVDYIVSDLGGGVGVELGDLGNGTALGGIDFDTCRNADGSLEEWATDLMLDLGSYAEVSPSSTGVKQFFLYDPADLPSLLKVMQTDGGKAWKRGGGKHPPAIELYLRGRYFAITGQHVPETPLGLTHVSTDTLLQLVRRDGPAFALSGKRASSARKTIVGTDGSRSAMAMRIGAGVKRNGGTFEEMCAAIREHPETAEWYQEKALANGSRELTRIWEKAGAMKVVDGFDLTEDGIALAFTAAFSDKLRYCHTTGAWFEWSGTAWRKDERKLAFSWSRRICRQIAKAAGVNGNDLAKLAKAATAASVERFAQADEAFAVTSVIWDSNPFLMGTPEGTLNLLTGLLREPMPEDHITKLAAVAPSEAAHCPLWLKFLSEATGNDAALIRFLQQWCGYTLTGDVREHALLFIFGAGGNGKSVFANVVSGIMAEYCRVAAMETFTASQNDKHPTDLAMLKGARMVTASETEEGRSWAESRIKTMTGGDTVSARFMRQDFFEYLPEFKLTIIGNHKPQLRNVDEAARRRFNIVPFTRKPVNPDRELEKKLRAEWPAILRWMVEGCLDWQQNGLLRPPVVVDATAEYFSEQDTVHQWVEECCILGATQSDTLATLFKSWTDYTLANGEKPGTTKWFSQTLARLGCEAVKNTPGENGKRGFKGIGVKRVKAPSPHDPEDE